MKFFIQGLYACFIAFAFLLVFEQGQNVALLNNAEGANDEAHKAAARELAMLADPTTGKIPEGIRSKELAYYKTHFADNFEFAYSKRGDNWYSAGPWNVGGRTRTVALDVTNEKIILAASVSGGIWRSIDGGATWTKTTGSDQHPGFVSISQDKRNGKQNIWYALSGEGYGTSASGGSAFYLGDGAFKSIDSGKSWTPLTQTAGGVPGNFSSNFQIGWRVATHPSVDSDRVYLACYSSIMRSADGGASWKQVLGTGNDHYFTDVVITKTGVLYAALSGIPGKCGFFRSTDGLSWTNITPSQYVKQIDRTVMGINPNNENEVYFFSYFDSTQTNPSGTVTTNYKDAEEWIALYRYTYVSGDGSGSGGTWLDLSVNLPNKANVTSGPFDKLNCQGGYNMAVTVQPGTNAVFIAGTNIFRSTDAFATKNNYTQIGGYKPKTYLPFFEIYPVHHPDNHEMIFLPSDNSKLISASDGGVRITKDAMAANVEWVSLNDGYVTSQVYTATIDEKTPNDKWLIGGFQDNGNFMSTNMDDAKHKWVMPFNGDGAYNYIAPYHDFCVLSIQEGRIVKFKIDNNGNRVGFRRIDPIGPAKEDYGFINPFVVDPNDNNFMYLPAGKAIYRQSELNKIKMDGRYDSIAQGWTKLYDSANAEITAVAVSKSPANVVYFGTRTRNIYRIDNANSANPIVKNITKSPLPAGTTYVSSIAIDPEDANKVLVCYSNYNIQSLFYTDDGGNTWKYCGGKLEENTNSTAAAPSVRWVSIMKTPNGKRKYFAGTSIGLFSADSLVTYQTPQYDSTHWLQESPDLIGANVVGHITYRQSDYTLAVATHGNGIFVSKYFDSEYSNNAKEKDLIVFPNPTTNLLRIKTQNYNEDNGAVVVYDMTGRIVYKQDNISFNTAQSYYDINTSTWASGQYILLVALPASSETKKYKFVVKASL